jgi:hypothetical protein
MRGTGDRSRGLGTGREIAYALDRWIGDSLASQHQDAFTAELPETWLSMIAMADRAAEKQRAST